MNYRLSSEAEEEVEQAVDFYTQQASKLVALAFLAEFARTARLVAANPGIGTRTSRGRRRFPLHRFPYSLIYRVEEDCICIGAVAHHSRRPGYWGGRA